MSSQNASGDLTVRVEGDSGATIITVRPVFKNVADLMQVDDQQVLRVTIDEDYPAIIEEFRRYLEQHGLKSYHEAAVLNRLMGYDFRPVTEDKTNILAEFCLKNIGQTSLYIATMDASHQMKIGTNLLVITGEGPVPV